jgi:segregation and condensation protein B
MDDKGTLCIATDCVSDDSAIRSADDDLFADVEMPAEDAPLLPPECEGSPAFDMEESETTDHVLGADVAGSPGNATDRAEDPHAALHRQVIESLLFSSDTALSAARLADLVESCTPASVRRHIAALNDKYERAGLSFRIEAIARGYQMMTLPSLRSWVARLEQHRRETRLSAAALETLSVIAYKQPVIRADVEAIRGVACGEVISRLREMGLVRVLGRAEIVGRPLLYGTTKRFLDTFGLADLDDLPPMEALRLKPVTKSVDEVEPVKPPPIPEPLVEQLAAIGA